MEKGRKKRKTAKLMLRPEWAETCRRGNGKTSSRKGQEHTRGPSHTGATALHPPRLLSRAVGAHGGSSASAQELKATRSGLGSRLCSWARAVPPAAAPLPHRQWGHLLPQPHSWPSPSRRCRPQKTGHRKPSLFKEKRMKGPSPQGRSRSRGRVV